MFENWPAVPQATVIPLPQRNWRDDPNLSPRVRLRVEIERTVQKVWEADTDLLSDQLFLAAVHAIGSKYSKMRGEAARMWGIRSNEYIVAEALTLEQETHDYTNALAAWKREHDRETNPVEDEIEVAEAAE